MFHALVKTKHNTVIKCFRCDLGGEYTSNKLCELLSSNGTFHRTSCIDTPQHNGVAERKHRYIVKTTRSLLLSQFQVSFRVKLFLLLSILLIESHPLLPQVCLPSKSCMVVFLITLL